MCYSEENSLKVAIQIKVAVALALIISRQAIGAEEVVDSDVIRANQVISGAVKIGRRIIPLPDGNWQLVNRIEKNSSSDGSSQMPTIVTLYFQEIQNGRLHRGLEVAATTSSSRMNWQDEPCKSKNDSYWIDDKKRGMNDQFCLRVGYMSGVVDGARGEAFQLWARNIREKEIGYSPEMPFLSVIRYTPYDYLRMSINFDPDISGIAKSANVPRQFNDWQGQTVNTRPQHAKFYDSLVSWAPVFATAVQRAFDNDKYLSSKDFGAPSFPPKP